MPNGGLEKVGVELIAQGADKFLASLEKATQGLDAFTAATMKAPAAAGAVGAAGAAAAAGPIALGVAAAGAALKIGETLVKAIGRAIDAARQFAAEGVMLAGRFQEMEFTALAVGRAMGYQEQEIRSAISAVQEAGIRYDAAATTVAQFARNQIDFASATELANLAQATGIMIGEDSSATMERLTLAIATGSTARLRALGIVFDNQEALEAEAVALGKSVEAMTQAEKAQARVNAIIAAGKPLLDVYGAAMESPTKAMRSLAGRVIPELQASIGQFFLPALMTVVSSIKNFVEALTAATQEGGALRPVLVNLGAAVSLLADAFAGALDFLTDWINNFQGTLFGGMSATVEGMLRWGFEMVAALAEGMVNAASTVLIAAMNAIGSVLASWLGPGSPPRVAPGLTDWGVEAMTEWLKGFTQADFSMLKAVQGPLRQILSGVEFADISQQLTEALAVGGVDGSFFDIIAQSAGEFGTEIAELARRQHALAEATTAVEESEQRLKQARHAQKMAQASVSRLTREYNELLREGASREVLAAKMAELRAAEERVGVTAQQAEEAEAENQAAQAQQTTLKEQLVLQQQLVDQLLLVAKAQQVSGQETEATKEKIESLRGELRGIPDAMPTAAEFDIASRIGAAIDEAKDQLRKRLGDLFAPLTRAWANVKKEVGKVKETFDLFSMTVTETWTKIKEEFTTAAEIIEELLTVTLPAAFEWTKRSLLTVLKPAFVNVRNYLVNKVVPVLRDLADVYLAKIREISDKIAHVWQHTLLPAFENVYDWVKDNLIPLFDPYREGSLGAVLSWFLTGIIQPLGEAFWWVVSAIQAAIVYIQQLIDLIGDIPGLPPWITGLSPPPLALYLMDIAAAARLATVDLARFSASVGGLSSVPVSAMPVPAMVSSPQTITTTNEMNVNVGPNTLQTPLDVDMLAIAVEQRLMRSMRL